jgi:hypothetical protein
MLAGGALSVAPETANAGVWFFSRSGQDSYFAAGVHGYDKPDPAPARSLGTSIRRIGIRYSGDRPVWRETSVLEYEPAAMIPHGDHYDVVPGRYEYRSSGYWH